MSIMVTLLCRRPKAMIVISPSRLTHYVYSRSSWPCLVNIVAGMRSGYFTMSPPEGHDSNLAFQANHLYSRLHYYEPYGYFTMSPPESHDSNLADLRIVSTDSITNCMVTLLFRRPKAMIVISPICELYTTDSQLLHLWPPRSTNMCINAYRTGLRDRWTRTCQSWHHVPTLIKCWPSTMSNDSSVDLQCLRTWFSLFK